MRKQSGFSLVELLIVVAIILIIAAISIPNLLRARIAANESSAVMSLRTINTGEVSYATQYSQVGYAVTLANLAGDGSVCPSSPSTAHACLIDNTLATDGADSLIGKGGYFFTMSSDANLGYTVTGQPIISRVTGYNYFYSDSTNVIRKNAGSPANGTSPSIQ